MGIYLRTKDIKKELIEERLQKYIIHILKNKIYIKDLFDINSNKIIKEKYLRKNSENIIENKKRRNKIGKSLLNLNSKKNNIYINFFLKLLIIFISIPFSESKLRKLDFLNEITLITKKTEHYKSFISENYVLSEVIINGDTMGNPSNNYKFPEEKNTVIIKWDSPLKSTSFMFYNMDIILFIDLSDFDTSKLTVMTSMFHGCLSLTSINFKNINTSLVTTMEDMFSSCSSLISLDLSGFDTSLVTSMSNMFKSCSSLIAVDLSSFNTTSVEKFDSMFFKAESLIFLDLSNFNTSSLSNIIYFLTECKSLRYVNLISFIEKNYVNTVNIMKDIYENVTYCIDSQRASRIYKDIQSYNKNNDCNNTCFSGKKKLIIEKNECIDDCKNDNIYINEIINICYNSLSPILEKVDNNEINESSEENENENSEYVISTEKEESEGIIDNDETEEISEKEGSSVNTENFESTEKYETTEKEDSIEEEGNSVSIENDESTEKYEITEKYDSSNIEGISQNVDYITTEIDENIEKEESEKNLEITEKEITEKINIENTEENKESGGKENNKKTEVFEEKKIDEIIKINESTEKEEKTTNIEKNTEKTENSDKEKSSNYLNTKTEEIENSESDNTKQKLDDYSAEEFFKDSLDLNNEDTIKKDEIIQIIKEDIMNGKLNNSLLNVLNGEKKDLIKSDKNTIYQITTTENQNNNEYNNISTVNLGDCEDRLKGIYGIDKNLSLIIFKIDYYKEGLLIPVIGYEIYHPINKSLLNLTYCEDILIKLNIPVSIDESNLFIYDPNSEYYTDECFAYTTENGTDILLNDRKTEYIYNNLSLCEANCIYNGYNEDTKKALCECESKNKIGLISDIINNENILSNDFIIDNSSSSVITMKCTHTLFSKEGLITNIGNYLLVFTFIFFMISAIIFYKCGYSIIENKIKNILATKRDNKKVNKTQNKINIFDGKQAKKKLNTKLKKKKKKLKNKNSNPIKKTSKKLNTIKKGNKNQDFHVSSSKLEFKNTNIIINIGKNKKNKKNKKMLFTYNNIKNYKKIIMKNYDDCELNSMNFINALNYDKRTFFQYYLSILKYNNLILFSFYPMNDYNLKIIKISLFFLSFDIYFFINSLFFNTSTIHQIYENAGVYDFSYFLPKIILSFFISYYIIIIIKYFSLSQRNLLELKNKIDMEKIDDVKIRRCLIIKYIIFYCLSFIFLTFFWYYLSSFCAVYKNSQFYVIQNTLISFGISLLYPILFNLLTSIIRITSLNGNKSINELLYKLSKFMQYL